MTKTHDAKRVAEATNDAYARDRYTDAAWGRIAATLANEGASPAEMEWVLRSKHMRWAADHANRSAFTTSADFRAYVIHIGGFEKLLRDARNNVKHDLPQAQASGADLAGSCEGEDVADLIDLAQMLANGQAANPIGATRLQNRALAILATIKARS